MNETVLDERVGSNDQPRTSPVISGRSLLLRLLFAVVTVATLSIGGAWLMNAGIDPAAEASEGVGSSNHDGAQSEAQAPNGTAASVGR
jgi:hypothetical protein